MSRAIRYGLAALLLGTPALAAQDFATEDPVLQGIWTEGMQRSEVPALAQTLMDSLGPRLTGSPQSEAAQAWAVATYDGWGIDARLENYGTYTWHTNRDTFDKLVLDEVRSNAVLTAMLAYMAADAPDRMPRARRTLPPDPRTGEASEWRSCRDGQRTGG